MTKQNKSGNKSSNPSNPECSSVKQALLDLQAAGFNNADIQSILDKLDKNPNILKQADKLYHSHQHPQNKIVFTKITNQIEYCRFLSAQAAAILTSMCLNMRHGNLIQMSQDDIIKITGVANKKTVHRALDELIKNGTIAIKLQGNTRRATIYMINPAIATVGTDIPYLDRIFWETTGTEYSFKNDPVMSDPHKKWQELTACRTYTAGYDSIETRNGQIIYFNRINDPSVDKSATQKKTPDVGASSVTVHETVPVIPDAIRDGELPLSNNA